MAKDGSDDSTWKANTAYFGLFISGVASAATTPYLSTVGLDNLRLTGTQYSVVVFASGILAIVISISVGWLSDIIAARRGLIAILAVTASLGIGLFVLFGNLMLFILCCLIFLPLTSILTQQFFAHLRAESQHLDKLAIENRNARGRAVFASAWVTTPLVFLVAPRFDPANLAFITAAIACLIGAIAFSPVFRHNTPDTMPPPRVDGPSIGGRSAVGVCLMLAVPLLACGALRAAPRLQQILLGPIITQGFSGSFSDIGFLSGLTALLELPLILFWGYALRFMTRPTMLLAGSLFSGYFTILYLARSMPAIYASSLILALATSGTLSITISYLQNLLPDRPGLGSSLISVANCLGAAIAALAFAPFSEVQAYQDCAIAAAIIVAAGGIAIWLWEEMRRSRHVTPS